MIVVADTSPVNYLVIIDQIGLLPKLFGTVVVPQAVLDELLAAGSPDPVKTWLATDAEWIDVRSAAALDDSIQLGIGEREAISLGQEIGADLMLIDDRKARRAALKRGLAVAGTINILESASKRGLVDLAMAFDRLRETNFRIDTKLLDEMLDQS